ncbi:ASCH domain-containing protein [Mesorhizobium sp. B2-3-4]|uniref:ASCH domain-containing protein n=1 Tax=Mesorhizobium sp. B2-3-4 TaxID=2589959 RepID=UPI00112A14DE|nr:ASCH domain-containing protein [Mesorhizobium sp. B2-3-4]TPM41577.1 ASCH domain-containing protein [Mesorhizobium sp. B2-3-4]
MIDLPELALSVRQPWTWSIMHAGKDIENRDWPTRVRGRICLHAAKGMTRDEYEDCLDTLHGISLGHHFPPRLTLPAFDKLDRGGIVGTVDITDCVSASKSPWFFGRYGFVLRNPEPLPEMIPVKGALGFFRWRDNLNVAPAAKPISAQGSLL